MTYGSRKHGGGQAFLEIILEEPVMEAGALSASRDGEVEECWGSAGRFAPQRGSVVAPRGTGRSATCGCGRCRKPCTRASGLARRTSSRPRRTPSPPPSFICLQPPLTSLQLGPQQREFDLAWRIPPLKHLRTRREFDLVVHCTLSSSPTRRREFDLALCSVSRGHYHTTLHCSVARFAAHSLSLAFLLRHPRRTRRTLVS